MTKHKDIIDRVRGAEMEGSQGNNHGNDEGQGNKKATAFSKTSLNRIMRHALQRYPQAKIDEDARDAVDRCALEFANLVTTVAAEECQKERRTIVNGDDLINAMYILGFKNYVSPLNEYLRRYRDSKAQLQPPSNYAMRQPPATAMVMGEIQAPAPQQPFGFVLGQQPQWEATELQRQAPHDANCL